MEADDWKIAKPLDTEYSSNGSPAITKKREKTILWNAVLAQGTGFFQIQTPQHGEARQWAWAHMRSAIDDAGREGADPEFLQACTLYLAELAAVDVGRSQWVSHDAPHDQDPQGQLWPVQTPKGKAIHGVHTAGAMTAIDRMKSIRRSLDKRRQEWMEANRDIEGIHRHTGEKVDAAFATLMKRLDTEIEDISLLLPERREQKGRPPQDAILHCLSGLRQHFENTIGTSRPLLHNLASSLNPPLPMKVTSAHLRSVISAYRRRHTVHGPTDFESLNKEFKRFHKKFTNPA